VTRRFIPRLESLEGRTLPSALTVLNNLDSGPGSLRAALAAANNGDVITFAPSLSGKTITLTSGVINVNTSVTITGPGAGQLAISGYNRSEILHIAAGASVTVSGLTLTHGVAGAGGAIDNAGSLTLSNDSLLANQSLNGNGGGAIVNEAGATLTMTHCTLTGNSAGGSGTNVYGGALLNDGSAQINATTFQANRAVGGNEKWGPYDTVGGGAIANAGGGQLTLAGCMFTNNMAYTAAYYFATDGGAILNQAGATLNLNNCTLAGNRAVGAGGGTYGGALANQGNAQVTVGTFQGNQADTNGSAGGCGGGALANNPGGQLVVTGSLFTNNQTIASSEDAEGFGGAIYNNAGNWQTPLASATISSSTFTGNQAISGPDADALGGAIVNGWTGATMTLTSCTITGNRALGGASDGYLLEGEGMGGGIVNEYGAQLTVKGGTISANRAVGGSNNTPDNNDRPLSQLRGAGQGGGICNIDASANITNATIANNQTVGGSLVGSAATGGGIDNLGPNYGQIYPFIPGAQLTVVGCTITGNRAIAGSGGPSAGAANVPTGYAAGGGIDDSLGGTATVRNCTISGNQAIGSQGGIDGPGAKAVGGGISVGIATLFIMQDVSTLTLTGSTLTGNLALGGAAGPQPIWDPLPNGQVPHPQVNGNGGDGLGGGLAVFARSTATQTACTIQANTARGGAAGWQMGYFGHGIGGGTYAIGTITADAATMVTNNHASTSNNDIYTYMPPVQPQAAGRGLVGS
jgi:hypothetical protein